MNFATTSELAIESKRRSQDNESKIKIIEDIINEVLR